MLSGIGSVLVTNTTFALPKLDEETLTQLKKAGEAHVGFTLRLLDQNSPLDLGALAVQISPDDDDAKAAIVRYIDLINSSR